MFYLCDRTTNKVKAAYKDLSGIPINGFRVVAVPNDVDIDPTDATANPPVFEYDDLIRQKYQGILANNPEFSSILYDDLTDATFWDTGNSLSFAVGDGFYWLSANNSSVNGVLRSNSQSLSGTYSRFKLVWDIYEIDRTLSDSFNYLYYQEIDPDSLDVEISTDGANPFETIYHDEATNLTAGGNIRIQFTNTTSNRYYIGGFALLY